MLDTSCFTREATVLARLHKTALSSDPSTFSNAFVHDALEWFKGFTDSLRASSICSDKQLESEVSFLLRTAASEQGCPVYVAQNYMSVSALVGHGELNFLLLFLTNPFVPEDIHAYIASLLLPMLSAPTELSAGCVAALAAGRDACAWFSECPEEAEKEVVARVSGLIAGLDEERLHSVLKALAARSTESPACLRIGLGALRRLSDSYQQQPPLHPSTSRVVAGCQCFVSGLCGEDFFSDALLDSRFFTEALSMETFREAVKEIFFNKVAETFRGIAADGRVPGKDTHEENVVARLGKCYRVLITTTETKNTECTLQMQIERFGVIFKHNAGIHRLFIKTFTRKNLEPNE